MLPQLGKVDRASFDRIIFPRLGKADPTVLLGPKHGVDAAVIELSGNQVMVIAEDPTFGMPVLMPYFGWCIVHICASDIAVLGVKPRYLTICLMLPPGTSEDVLENIWKQVHEECEKLGIAIVGGHTGMYPGITYPLNGGCTVIGLGTKDQITPASNARVGDRIIITKGPAIEATGILAFQAEKTLEKKFGKDIVAKAKKRFFDMSVVEDALLAAPYAHAMHDATEGGLLNGVYEVAAASDAGVNLYEDKIAVPDDIGAVCSHFNIDPLISISEGTLVIAATPENASRLIKTFEQKGVAAWDVGEVTPKGRTFIRKNGNRQDLVPVAVDPFWAAYFSTLQG
jgi:hydrogenase expression/formation protein HypE